MTLNNALFTPTPRASVSTVAAVKPGLRPNSRSPYRTSRASASSLFQPHASRLASRSNVMFPKLRRVASGP